MTIELPAQVFFKPAKAWWNFLLDTPWLKYRAFIDVGAGMGHLTNEMIKRGFDCIGIDCNIRNGQSENVHCVDIQDLDEPLSWDNCAIIARPCHGTGLDRMLVSTVGYMEVLYVGKTDKVKLDLENHSYELLAEDIGEDKENVYRVWAYANDPDIIEVCLLEKPNGNSHNQWWENDRKRKRWVNAAGGGFPQDMGANKVLETKFISDFWQLHTEPERWHVKDGVDGWIEPDGTFHSGHYMEHAPMLHSCFGIIEARAEKLGFIRTRKTDDGKLFYTCKKNPTDAQGRRLRALGFDTSFDKVELDKW